MRFRILLLAIPTVLATRQLYDIATSGKDCSVCSYRGLDNCWGRLPDSKGGSGNWAESYCCGPTDIKCKEYTYCSSKVSQAVLQ